MRLKVLSMILVVLSLSLSGFVIHEKTTKFGQFERGMTAAICAVNLIQNAMWSEQMAVEYCICAAKTVDSDLGKLTPDEDRRCMVNMINKIRNDGNASTDI
jgi:hypothetical protein